MLLHDTRMAVLNYWNQQPLVTGHAVTYIVKLLLTTINEWHNSYKYTVATWFLKLVKNIAVAIAKRAQNKPVSNQLLTRYKLATRVCSHKIPVIDGCFSGSVLSYYTIDIIVFKNNAQGKGREDEGSGNNTQGIKIFLQRFWTTLLSIPSKSFGKIRLSPNFVQIRKQAFFYKLPVRTNEDPNTLRVHNHLK